MLPAFQSFISFHTKCFFVITTCKPLPMSCCQRLHIEGAPVFEHTSTLLFPTTNWRVEKNLVEKNLKIIFCHKSLYTYFFVLILVHNEHNDVDYCNRVVHASKILYVWQVFKKNMKCFWKSLHMSLKIILKKTDRVMKELHVNYIATFLFQWHLWLCSLWECFSCMNSMTISLPSLQKISLLILQEEANWRSI